MSKRMHVMRLTASLDVDDLSHELDDEQAFELVTMLDEARGDWAFTLRLADHFDKLRAEHAKEEAEDDAARAAFHAKQVTP